MPLSRCTGSKYLGDRIRNVEVEQLGRPLQPFRMLRALEDLAAIGALAFEYRAGVMQSVGEHMQRRLPPRDQLAVVPDHPLEAVIRLFCHGDSSSGRRPAPVDAPSSSAFASRADTRYGSAAHESALAPRAQSVPGEAAGTILSWRPVLG